VYDLNSVNQSEVCNLVTTNSVIEGNEGSTGARCTVTGAWKPGTVDGQVRVREEYIYSKHR